MGREGLTIRLESFWGQVCFKILKKFCHAPNIKQCQTNTILMSKIVNLFAAQIS